MLTLFLVKTKTMVIKGFSNDCFQKQTIIANYFFWRKKEKPRRFGKRPALFNIYY